MPIIINKKHLKTPGAHLYRLVLNALISLEARSAKVLSVVCDGAASKQNMWKLFGVSGFNLMTESLNNKAVHPTAPEYYLLSTT